MMSGYEPEVCLAVRIPKSDETTGLVEDHSETEKESNTDIDTVLMSYGFEYIDATGQVPLRQTGEVGDELSSTVGLQPYLILGVFRLIFTFFLGFASRYTSSSSGVGCVEHHHVAIYEIRP